MTDKEYRLTKSKVFCMSPWISLNNSPNGDILPCCIYRNKPFGNLHNNTMEEIWNNDDFKKFRRNMLNDIPDEGCNRCYKYEEWGTKSTRNHLTEGYGDLYDTLMSKTQEDGGITDVNLFRWDFRFNNLCNLACVGCSPEFSTPWIDLQQKMYPGVKPFKVYNSFSNREKFLNTLKTQSQVVKEIYFAGGEPLIQPEHYEILKEIDSLNRFEEVLFSYSTNLTKLSYKKNNVLDYWKKMKRIKALVSIDEVNFDKLFYMRHPASLDDIYTNLKLINQVLNSEEKSWSVTPAWSILNLHRIKDIIEYFHKNNLLPYSFYVSISWEIDIHNIVLMQPSHLSISNASKEWKEYLNNHLTEYQEWYHDVLIPLKQQKYRNSASILIKKDVEKFRNCISEDPKPVEITFNDWVRRLDGARGTDFKKTFPELEWCLNF